MTTPKNPYRRNFTKQIAETQKTPLQQIVADARGVPQPVRGDALVDIPIRELILLAGKDGCGKTSALVSLAHHLQETAPDKTIWVLDTESKFRSILRGFGPPPANIAYFPAATMNEVTAITAEILRQHQPGDWMLIESLSRIWERAQDLGYMAVAGAEKADYLETRRSARRGGQPLPPVTPRPDDLWSIAKGALNGGFLDLLANEATNPGTLNVLMSAPLAKARDPKFDSKERKATRTEFGMDLDIAGPPLLPYLVETLALLEGGQDGVTCRVLRDNLSPHDDSRVTFPVVDRRGWAPTFFATCREE